MADQDNKNLIPEEEDAVLETADTENGSESETPAKTGSSSKKSDGKSSKPKKKKRNRVAKWFRDLIGEAKKVIWPSGKSVLNNTLVVIVVVVVVAIFVAILDIVFGTVVQQIANLLS